jgi:hypothetical protein
MVLFITVLVSVDYKMSLTSLLQEDEGLKEEDLEAAQHMFYQRPVATTSGYLARSVVNSVLKGAIMHKVDEETKDSKGGADYSCPVQ